MQQLEGINQRSLMLVTTQLTKMKVNTADAPYIVQKGPASQWQFTLTYTTVDQILLLLHEQLAASRLPYADRKEALQVHMLLCVENISDVVHTNFIQTTFFVFATKPTRSHLSTSWKRQDATGNRPGSLVRGPSNKMPLYLRSAMFAFTLRPTE